MLVHPGANLAEPNFELWALVQRSKWSSLITNDSFGSHYVHKLDL